ncbi:hypothetical protein [Chachezhania sediminis]|uniref:hypothetical protein n=1 Tax=Chachezhania sediminis TaxID=2599291 RepID=UPI00131C26EE|nr:hypothetical protein [Chachezhania sediminis]
MYVLKPGIKRDPVRRWALPDRIFFGHGACAILAGTWLRDPPLPGFHAERIIPAEGLPGNHVYLTDGQIAFDYHGYSILENLLAHHARGWSARHDGWHCSVETVGFDLLSTPALNARKMLGPDQYLHDPISRAARYLSRIDHQGASARARPEPRM